MYLVLFIAILFWLLCVLIAAISYWHSTYYKLTHRSFLKINFDKGAYGEFDIYRCLRRYETDGAKFLFNCYLPKNNNETSEIDVMMIYRSGIYVFESKNYSGWIFGSESNKVWTQTLPNGRKARKEKFYNPIMQNRTHIKWLEKQMNPTDPLHSIIVFSQRCQLKKLDVTSADVSVIKRDSVSGVVAEIDKRVGPRLGDERINQIYELLYPYTQVSDDVKKSHIEYIEKNFKTTSSDAFIDGIIPFSRFKDATVKNVCPNCGGELVLRTAKKGENAGNKFYGCSNYPKCRYIKNISE